MSHSDPSEVLQALWRRCRAPRAAAFPGLLPGIVAAFSAPPGAEQALPGLRQSLDLSLPAVAVADKDESRAPEASAGNGAGGAEAQG